MTSAVDKAAAGMLRLWAKLASSRGYSKKAAEYRRAARRIDPEGEEEDQKDA